MKKFLFIYNASGQEDGGTDAEWMAWFQSIGAHVVDIGNPIQGGTLVKSAQVSELSSKSDLVGGYSLINAKDIEEAATLAKNCPGKAGVRIFETIPM